MSLVFNLRIAIGNDAMRTADDLASALRRIADDVESPRDLAPFAEVDEFGNLDAGSYQTIFDDNGNSVGQYAVKYDERD